MLQASAGELWAEVEAVARTIPGWVAFKPAPAPVQREFYPLTPATFVPSPASSVLPAVAPALEPMVVPVAQKPKTSVGKSAFVFFAAIIGIPLAVWLASRETDKAIGRR